MLNPTTGFITIKDFGETTSDEFERAVRSLKAQGMKSLILDLRFNGGGMLDAALGICRQLLGPNELIVTQRGRDGRDVEETRTPKGSSHRPLPHGRAHQPGLRLGLGDRHRAPSRTTTGAWWWARPAGARGWCRRSWPSTAPAGLALTTARYYTPSGRCIQRDYMHGLDDYLLPDEDPKEPAPPQGPKFKTDLGRVVYGSGGITPDYFVDGGKLTPFVANLRYRNSAFFKFAVLEKEKHGIKPQQEVTDAPAWPGSRPGWRSEKIEFTEADWKDPQNQSDMRDQLAIEMQNVAYGVEAGLPLHLQPGPPGEARPWRSCPRPRPCCRRRCSPSSRPRPPSPRWPSNDRGADQRTAVHGRPWRGACGSSTCSGAACSWAPWR